MPIIRSRSAGLVAALALLLTLAAGCGSDDDGGTGPGPTPDPVDQLDPAPDVQVPGEYTCDGCPDSDEDTFNLQAGAVTTYDFEGTVDGAVGDGRFYILAEDGEQVAGPIPTDDVNGQFSFTAPLFCGTQLLKCVWSNDVGRYVIAVEVVTDNCTEPDIRITLSWDELGDDFELHLIKPGGRINDDATDCTWTSCVDEQPDWGVLGDASDDPRKDVDDTGAFGPENIFLANPEPGLYTVMVEHWGSGSPEADGQVVFNVDRQTTVATVENLAPRSVWTVGTIAWPSGVVTLDGSIFDCSGNWSGGCLEDLPGGSARPAPPRLSPEKAPRR